MNVQFLTDEHGRRTAVVVPISEWESLQEKIQYLAELSPEEMKEFDSAREDVEAHPEKLVPLEQVMKGFGVEPRE
ncbi:MAG: type II toxin-antitoxin system prevent-host-death family antitoxin [Thermodesulfobacteriota bacterium]